MLYTLGGIATFISMIDGLFSGSQGGEDYNDQGNEQTI